MNAAEVETRRQLHDKYERLSIRHMNMVQETQGRELTRGEYHASAKLLEEIAGIDRQLAELGTSAPDGKSVGAALQSAAGVGVRALPGEGVVSAPGQHPMPNVVPTDVQERLYDAFRSGRSESIPIMGLEDSLRTISGPPMAAVADYRPTSVYDVRYDMFRVMNLLRASATQAKSVVYYRETTGSTAAATVAEGGLKPESSAAWAPVTSTVQKLAHFSDVTKEAIEDYPGFQAAVNRSLLMGLLNAENANMLSGDGTGTNLLGLLNQPGILTYAPGTAEARIFSIRKALTILQQGSAYESVADAILLNPADWEKVQLTTATGSGEFMDEAAGLVTGGRQELWSIPVKTTNRIPAGTALLGNFGDAGEVFVREAPSFFVDPYSQSNYNRVRILCEERVSSPALGRPTALVKVTFNGTA